MGFAGGGNKSLASKSRSSGSFLSGQSKIGLESWPGQRLRIILVKGGGIKVSS